MGRRDKRRKKLNDKKVYKNIQGSSYTSEKTFEKDFPAASSVGGSFFSSTQQNGAASAVIAFTISPWFRAVVTKIAQHFSSVGWVLLSEKGSKQKGKDNLKKYKTLSFENRLRMRKELEVIEISPVMDIFQRPNAQMTGRAVRELMMIWYDITGESALLKSSLDGGFGLGALWPIAPQWITELPTEDKPYYTVTRNGKRIAYPVEDMIFWKSLSPVDPYARGSGLGMTMGDEIETDEMIAKYTKATLQNDARPSQIVSVKGKVGKPALERVKFEFENSHRGFWNAGRTFFAPGDVDVHQLSQTFAELELTAQRSWLRDQFIHLYGVPPELLGISADSNRATSLEAKTTMAEEVIIPRLESYKEIMQQQLIDPINPSWILDYEDPRPFNRKDQIEYMNTNPSMASVREWRDVLNLEDRGEVDDYHLIEDGVNAIPIDEMGSVVSGFGNEIESNEESESKSLAIVKGTNMGEDALEALRPERLIDATSNLHKEELKAWLTRELAGLGVTISFDLLNPLLAKYFDNYNNVTLTGINETTKKLIAKQLSDGIALGEGSKAIAKRVREVLQSSNARALMIARTEVLRGSNFGTFESMRLSGVVTKKQWVSTMDMRTRDAHVAMNGQPRPINEPFNAPDGSEAMHPGDFGIAELDINCRCTTTAVIDDIPKNADELGMIWKSYISETASWEDAMSHAFEEAFKNQLSDVEKAIGKWI